MSTRDDLLAVFEADRSLRAAEERLLAEPDGPEIVEVLADAAREAFELGDAPEAQLRLCRLADLCAQVPGPKMADTLIAILGHDDPAVRLAAGEALRDVGYERYAEVARAVDRTLDAGLSGLAATELPWVLAEIGEPSAVRQISRFLTLADADAVAAAIESLAELGDPSAAAAVEALVDDPREVSFEDFEEETTTTVGELAVECLAALGAGDDP